MKEVMMVVKVVSVVVDVANLALKVVQEVKKRC